MSDICIICLNNDPNFKNLNETDENNVGIIIKLRKCVPEVEWKIDEQICLICLQQLENVCIFRDMCIKSYFSRQTLEIKKEEQEETIAPNCEENFKLEEHSKKKICDACSKTLSSDRALRRHKNVCGKKEAKSDTNICDICGRSYGHKYLLKRHIKSVHATEKKFKCEQCDRKFATLDYLKAHNRTHLGERKHICLFCGKGFVGAGALFHHEKVHANKREYKCQLCPKAFNTGSELHKHKICVHQDASHWKYQCSFCLRKFPTKSNLDGHTRTHTGERNFACHLCDRKCVNNFVLKRHIKSHSVVKSFKCNLCLLDYKYQKSFDNHMVEVHGIGDVQ